MIAALLGEGSGDKALLPILRWLLGQATSADVRLEWIDTGRFDRRPRTLSEKVAATNIASPCDLLFVHRDADRQPPEWRYDEIQQAVGNQNYVAIVPIRMTEAWLLIDAGAIRAASGRITGTEDLGLPPLARLETDLDPKVTLHNALTRAHGATGRRARRFDESKAVPRLADLIEDWSPLRQLSAFQRAEADTRTALTALGLPIRHAST